MTSTTFELGLSKGSSILSTIVAAWNLSSSEISTISFDATTLIGLRRFTFSYTTEATTISNPVGSSVILGTSKSF